MTKKTRKTARKVAKHLKIAIPGGNLPLVIKIITLFIGSGGLSLIGGIFGDIVRPPTSTPHFYLIRLIVGVSMVSVAYGIVTGKKWALWLYAAIVLLGLFINPMYAIIPLLVAIYLFYNNKA